jgi:hypothetical protein
MMTMNNCYKSGAGEQTEMFSISPADDTIFPPFFSNIHENARGMNGGVEFMSFADSVTSPAYCENIRGMAYSGTYT